MKSGLADSLKSPIFLIILSTLWCPCAAFAIDNDTQVGESLQNRVPETATSEAPKAPSVERTIPTSIESLMEGGLAIADEPILPLPAAELKPVEVIVNWKVEPSKARTHKAALENIHAEFLGITDITEGLKESEALPEKAKTNLAHAFESPEVKDYMVLELSYPSGTVFGAHMNAFEVSSRIGAQTKSTWNYFYPKDRADYKILILYQGKIEPARLARVAGELGVGIEYGAK